MTVKQHDGKDDNEGKRILRTKECGADYRLYAVSTLQLIKVTIKNLSAKPLSFRPVYLDTEGREEPEEVIEPLKQGEVGMHVCVCFCVTGSGRATCGVWACARVRACVITYPYV